MSTSQSNLDYILDQLSFLPDLKVKKMFGVNGLYTGVKYLGFISEGQLFFRSTPKLQKLLKEYGITIHLGSKNTIHIPDKLVENKDKLTEITIKYLKS